MILGGRISQNSRRTTRTTSTTSTKTANLSDNGGVTIEGMDEVIAKIKNLPDRTKRLEVLKILRRQMQTIKEAVKANTPVGTHASSRRVKSGQSYKYEVGNLKESIGIFTGKSKFRPMVFVGPAMGARKKHDGFYAFWVIYGARHYKNAKPNDFVRQGAAPYMKAVTGQMTDKLKKYIDKRITQL